MPRSTGRRVTCPYCEREVAVTLAEKLWPHKYEPHVLCLGAGLPVGDIDKQPDELLRWLVDQ